MIQNKVFKLFILGLILVFVPDNSFAQQDPQFTHYMYNTLSINPAYAGQRETLSFVGLNRTQWVGVSGAPETQTFSVHSPLRNEQIALGLNVVTDALGPARQTVADANVSYSIPLDRYDTKLTFGVKAGINNITTDWSEGIFQQVDPVFQQNVDQTQLLIGAGIYASSRNWYVGFSIPNFLSTDHYDDFEESLATERIHYYFTGGYVFDLNPTLKLKPAFLVKASSNAPTIADISANLLINDKFTLGAAYRISNAVSGLAGFQISKSLYVGYGYDLTTTDFNNYNSGTHEIILRFEIQDISRLLSPRFF